MTPVIGIDLGGTKIKVVLVDGYGTVLERRTHETGAGEDTAETAASFLRETIADLEKSAGLANLPAGLSAPGVPSSDRRQLVLSGGKIPGLEGCDWTKVLGRSRPVLVLNDAKAALLAEAWIGAARNHPNALLLTLGTGVGGAVLCEGKLLMGAHGCAGHFGHLSLDPFGAKSIFQSPGGLETWIGNATLPDRTGGRFSSTHELLNAVRQGDQEATAVWRKSIRALAAGIVTLLHAFDPDLVILGGGIVHAGKDLFEPLSAELGDMEWRPPEFRTPLVPAELGEWAGAIGAARFGSGEP